ncbi:hypothetical protein [Paenibacillus sp. GCM10012306]|uniref:hypothetical protein n=1 Tax=Paenibacillus sp. GCM10012306 TaxID=3317342 RepID=UPI003621828F
MQEPTGKAYEAVLQISMEVCDEFILVKRDQMSLDPSGIELLERLKPFFKEQRRDDHWPGTRLFGHYADIYYFQCCDEATEILLSYTTGLYSWVQPKLPDDLCFLRDGKPWLTNTAHEEQSFIDTDVEEELVRLEQSGLLIRDLSLFNWNW